MRQINYGTARYRYVQYLLDVEKRLVINHHCRPSSCRNIDRICCNDIYDVLIPCSRVSHDRMRSVYPYFRGYSTDTEAIVRFPTSVVKFQWGSHLWPHVIRQGHLITWHYGSVDAFNHVDRVCKMATDKELIISCMACVFAPLNHWHFPQQVGMILSNDVLVNNWHKLSITFQFRTILATKFISFYTFFINISVCMLCTEFRYSFTFE